MHISGIKIRNFRLLNDVELCLEKESTVIVGRNNSGKTSLSELFRRLLQDPSPSFLLEDFSLAALVGFRTAFRLESDGREENEIRDALPVVEVPMLSEFAKNGMGDAGVTHT